MSLPIRIIFNPFSHEEGDPFYCEWSPPAIPAFATPEDLAAVLIAYRTKHIQIKAELGRPLAAFGQVSDELLPELLMSAYKLSYMKDEGRYVVARLFVPAQARPPEPATEDSPPLNKVAARVAMVGHQQREAQLARRVVHRFNPKISLDNRQVIARLSQTLLTDDSSLVVEEQDGKLYLTELSNLDENGSEHDLLKMPHHWGVDGLLIHILGPGDLLVAEAGEEYRLRANEILVHQAACYMEPARTWLTELSRFLLQKAEKCSDWKNDVCDDTFLRSNIPLSDVTFLWSRVLRIAVRLRHGGAFVIVPDFSMAPITLKFPLEPQDVGLELLTAWLAVARIKDTPHEDRLFLDRINNKRLAVHRLLKVASSVGALSGTDGCVVLDRRLVLHGFGGSIKANRDLPIECLNLTTTTDHTEAISTKEICDRYGERHKSALRLVAEVPHSLAFVVSQDGDLRLFANDGKNIQFADNLQP